MTRSFALIAAVFGALVLVSAPALADDGEIGTESQFFEEYDTNADGIVTQDEFTGSGEVFRLLDTDKDGKITTTELGLPADYRPDPNAKAKREKAAKSNRGKGALNDRRKRIKQMFKAWDVNKDGAIAKDEWKGDGAAFDRIDRNNDGRIDKADLGWLMDGMDSMDGMDGMDSMGGPDGMPAPGKAGKKSGPKPNKEPRKDRAAALMSKLDTDQDGKITREEWRGKTEKFDKLDADGNGVIEAAELAPKKGATDRAKKPDGRDFSAEGVKNRFASLDKDQDGELTMDDGLGEAMLMNMDADNSGGVSLAEFQAAVEKARGVQNQRRRGNAKRMLRRFDTDKDGKVSRDEFPGSDQRFDSMDKNGDGYLSAEDFGDAAKPEDKPKKEAPVTPGTNG